MVASPLPDRELRHLLQFYLAPKMDYAARLAWAGSLILIGFAIQLLLPTTSVVVLIAAGVPGILAGTLLLLVKGYSLRPGRVRGGGTWEKTTRDRFTKMRQLEREVRKWDESFTDLTCVSGVVALGLLGMGVGMVWLLLDRSAATRIWAPVFVADAAVLLLPHWITGTRRGWRPVALRQTIGALETALTAIEPFESPSCQIQPLFEMAGKGERRVPADARVFVRFPDGPSSLLGLQFQVTMNNVQGTNYPYLYAVLVADKQFGLLDNFLDDIKRQIRENLPAKSKKDRLKIESSREADVEVVVIRQYTTKTSGYHTKPAAIRRIAIAAWRSAELVVRTAAHA